MTSDRNNIRDGKGRWNMALAKHSRKQWGQKMRQELMGHELDVQQKHYRGMLLIITGLQNTNKLHVGCHHESQCDETIQQSLALYQ